MPLCINSLGVDTERHTHIHMSRTKSISRNQVVLKFSTTLLRNCYCNEYMYTDIVRIT